MRLLLTTVSLDPVRGAGTTERTRHLALQLRRQGHEVTVVAIMDGSRADELRRAGIVVHVTGSVRLRFTVPLIAPVRLWRLIADSDAVHILGYWNLLSVAVGWMARRQRKPYLFSAAGEFAALDKGRWIMRLFHRIMGRRLVRGAAAIISITELERRDVARRFPEMASAVETIPNGVEAIEHMSAEPAPMPRTILFVGRLAQVKGPDLLLEAFARIVTRYPDLRLRFAGPDFGMLGELQERTVAHGLARRVEFVGYVDEAQRGAELADAAFLVVPSRSEAMSLVALEAGAAGCPVVATRTCGLDIIEELGCGLICDPSVEGIAAALATMLDDGVRRGKGQAWREHVLRHFTWERLAGQMAETFERIGR